MKRSEAIQIVDALIEGKSIFEALGITYHIVVNTSKEGFDRYVLSGNPDDLHPQSGERKRIMVEDFKNPRLISQSQLNRLIDENVVKSNSDNIDMLHKLRRFMG